MQSESHKAPPVFPPCGTVMSTTCRRMHASRFAHMMHGYMVTCSADFRVRHAGACMDIPVCLHKSIGRQWKSDSLQRPKGSRSDTTCSVQYQVPLTRDPRQASKTHAALLLEPKLGSGECCPTTLGTGDAHVEMDHTDRLVPIGTTCYPISSDFANLT